MLDMEKVYDYANCDVLPSMMYWMGFGASELDGTVGASSWLNSVCLSMVSM